MPRGVPGPVVRKQGTVTEPKKPKPGTFTKGHKRGGRPKGIPNKFTGELKRAILDGVHNANEKGLQAWVTALAKDTPTSAAALLGRLIPTNLEGSVDVNHTVHFKFD